MGKHGIKSVNELAKQINCPANTIYNLTKMTNKNPSIETVKSISDFFGITVDEFINHNLTIKALKKKKGLFPLFTTRNIKSIFNEDSSIHEMSHTELSEDAIAIKLEDDFMPFNKGNVLFFDKVSIESMSFPNICIIQDCDDVFLKKLYMIEGELYIREKKGIITPKPAFIHLYDKYKDPEVKYALMEIKVN